MQNGQPSPIVAFFKKIWPTVHRIVNSVFYFIMSVIKSIINGIISQIKGM